MSDLRALRRMDTGAPLDLTLNDKIGEGGEATVYGVRSNRELVAKIYHSKTKEEKNKRPERAKLEAMLRNRPLRADATPLEIAWPVALIGPIEDGRVAGMLMPRVPKENSIELVSVINPLLRHELKLRIDHRYLHALAANIAALVGSIHEAGHVICDINERNFLVGPTARATLVDTDSFQITDHLTGRVYPCPVLVPNYQPPELQSGTMRRRSPEQDRFGLAVVLFQMLMDSHHPFSGKGANDALRSLNLQERITNRIYFPFASGATDFTPPPVAPALASLAPNLGRLFIDCFVKGMHEPSVRPTAVQWERALRPALNRLRQCTNEELHWYGSHLPFCPYCELSTKARAVHQKLAAVQQQRKPPMLPIVSTPPKLLFAPTWVPRASLPLSAPQPPVPRPPPPPAPPSVPIITAGWWRFELPDQALTVLAQIGMQEVMPDLLLEHNGTLSGTSTLSMQIFGPGVGNAVIKWNGLWGQDVGAKRFHYSMRGDGVLSLPLFPQAMPPVFHQAQATIVGGTANRIQLVDDTGRHFSIHMLSGGPATSVARPLYSIATSLLPSALKMPRAAVTGQGVDQVMNIFKMFSMAYLVATYIVPLVIFIIFFMFFLS